MADLAHEEPTEAVMDPEPREASLSTFRLVT